jgi:ATP-binding cassette, subfamily B, bacterial
VLSRALPTAEGRQRGQPGAIPWIISHVVRYKQHLISFLVLTVIYNVTATLIPVMIGVAFDEVLRTTPDRTRLLRIALEMLALVLAGGLIGLVGNISFEFLTQRLERDARDELYDSLLKKSQTFHNRQQVGELMSRLTNDVRQLSAMMNPGIFLIFDSFLSLVIPLVFIGAIRLELLLAPLLFAIVFIITLIGYMNRLAPIAAQMREQFAVMNATLSETVSGIEVVKATAQEDQSYRMFAALAGRYRDVYVRHGVIQAHYIPSLLLGIAFAGGFLHGVLLLWRGQLSVGELVSYMGLMALLRYPTFISIFSFAMVQLGIVGADRILQLMYEETDVDQSAGTHRAIMRGEIVFENVSFGYGSTSALRNISFQARPGQTLAIVGETGSGKSTLTKLVNRTYDACAGRILIDGVDIREWDLASLRTQIGTIEQDIFLFNRSIADNITFGLAQTVDREIVEQAACRAQADTFIAGLPDGYETVIGEQGVTLSGGQRQRLAIARALLTNPRILILDDSTSAVDSVTEDAIRLAMRTVLQGRTTLLITHRLAQIRTADHILVLQGGWLIDQGVHTELLARCDIYRRIFAHYEDC